MMNNQRWGIACAVAAYGIWGLFPLYWKFLETVPALEILSHRVIWSGVLLLLMLLAIGVRQRSIALLLNPRQCLVLFASASILAVNWGLYIYGVNNDRIIETSLGYFINPLVNVLLGAVFLKERLLWGQWLAVALAAIGVGYSIISVGKLPWIALTLAFSFGLYGLLRKLVKVKPLLALTVETWFLLPIAIAFLLRQESNYLGQSGLITWLLIGSGIVTSVPLLCYGSAIQRLRLSTMGFFQYIAPSLQLGIGIVVYKEPFTLNNAIVFGFIWTALAVYTIVSFKDRKKVRA